MYNCVSMRKSFKNLHLILIISSYFILKTFVLIYFEILKVHGHDSIIICIT